MGVMDKVKQVAGGVGGAAKKGAAQVQTKVGQTQLRRKADDAAKRLGYVIYRERMGGGTPAAGEVDGLVNEIKQAEDAIAAGGASAATTSSDGGTAPTTRSSEPMPPTAPQNQPTTPPAAGTTSGPEVPPASGQASEEATGE
jgi:hypothetical protein